MSVPDRIWLKDSEFFGKDKPPAEWFRPEIGMTAQEYIRKGAADAALAAAKAEGVPVAASLAAAISLLERGGKKAAPSDKMFYQMLKDYRESLDAFRKSYAAGEP